MKRLIAIAVIVCVIGTATAIAQQIDGTAGGSGASCKPHRLAKAALELPHGATLVLHHPWRHSRVTFEGPGYTVKLRANRHKADAGAEGPVHFWAVCS